MPSKCRAIIENTRLNIRSYFLHRILRVYSSLQLTVCFPTGPLREICVFWSHSQLLSLSSGSRIPITDLSPRISLAESRWFFKQEGSGRVLPLLRFHCLIIVRLWFRGLRVLHADATPPVTKAVLSPISFPTYIYREIVLLKGQQILALIILRIDS